MRNYIVKFINDFNYPDDSKNDLLSSYDSIYQNEQAKTLFDKWIAIYNESYLCNYNELLKDCEKASLLTGIHEYTVKLLLFMCLSRRLKRYYEENNIDQEVWQDSMLDLKYKLIECKLIKGINGSFVSGWFVGFFMLTRFAFGRLQFEMSTAKYNYEKGGIKIVEGDPVINVHIPRSEAPLDRESCETSYKIAKKYFEPEFKGAPIAFVCNSWLLFEKNRDFLNEKSNIVKFMNKYDIIKTEYAGDGIYSQMWRLFDMDYTGDLNDFPDDTSLRRAYKKYLIDGGRQGSGYGIFLA